MITGTYTAKSKYLSKQFKATKTTGKGIHHNNIVKDVNSVPNANYLWISFKEFEA